METGHHVEGYFGNKFSSIYNRFGVMLKIFGEKFAFFGKTTPYEEIFKILFRKLGFTASPIDVLYSNFAKFGRPEIGKVVRYLPDKKNFAKFACFSRSCYCGDRTPKICQGQPQAI